MHYEAAGPLQQEHDTNCDMQHIGLTDSSDEDANDTRRSSNIGMSSRRQSLVGLPLSNGTDPALEMLGSDEEPDHGVGGCWDEERWHNDLEAAGTGLLSGPVQSSAAYDAAAAAAGEAAGGGAELAPAGGGAGFGSAEALGSLLAGDAVPVPALPLATTEPLPAGEPLPPTTEALILDLLLELIRDIVDTADPTQARLSQFVRAITEPAALFWPPAQEPSPLVQCMACSAQITGAVEHSELFPTCVRYASPAVAHGADCICNASASTQQNCVCCNPPPARPPWWRRESTLGTISVHQPSSDWLPCILSQAGGGAADPDPLILLMICEYPVIPNVPITRQAFHVTSEQDRRMCIREGHYASSEIPLDRAAQPWLRSTGVSLRLADPAVLPESICDGMRAVHGYRQAMATECVTCGQCSSQCADCSWRFDRFMELDKSLLLATAPLFQADDQNPDSPSYAHEFPPLQSTDNLVLKLAKQLVSDAVDQSRGGVDGTATGIETGGDQDRDPAGNSDDAMPVENESDPPSAHGAANSGADEGNNPPGDSDVGDNDTGDDTGPQPTQSSELEAQEMENQIKMLNDARRAAVAGAPSRATANPALKINGALRIGQLNVSQGFASSDFGKTNSGAYNFGATLGQYMQKRGIHILCIQETSITSGRAPHALRGLAKFDYTAAWRETSAACDRGTGVAIIYHTRLVTALVKEKPIVSKDGKQFYMKFKFPDNQVWMVGSIHSQPNPHHPMNKLAVKKSIEFLSAVHSDCLRKNIRCAFCIDANSCIDVTIDTVNSNRKQDAANPINTITELGLRDALRASGNANICYSFTTSKLGKSTGHRIDYILVCDQALEHILRVCHDSVVPHTDHQCVLADVGNFEDGAMLGSWVRQAAEEYPKYENMGSTLSQPSCQDSDTTADDAFAQYIDSPENEAALAELEVDLSCLEAAARGCDMMPITRYTILSKVFGTINSQLMQAVIHAVGTRKRGGNSSAPKMQVLAADLATNLGKAVIAWRQLRQRLSLYTSDLRDGTPSLTEPHLPPHEYAEAWSAAQRLSILVSTSIPLKAEKLCAELLPFIEDCISPALVVKLRDLQQLISDIGTTWSQGQPDLPTMVAAADGHLTPISDLPRDAELSPFVPSTWRQWYDAFSEIAAHFTATQSNVIPTGYFTADHPVKLVDHKHTLRAAVQQVSTLISREMARRFRASRDSTFLAKGFITLPKGRGGPRGGVGNSGEEQRIDAGHSLRDWMERKGPTHPSVVSRLCRIGHNGAMNTSDWASLTNPTNDEDRRLKDAYADSVHSGKWPADQCEYFNRPLRLLSPAVQALIDAGDAEIERKFEYFGIHALGPDTTTAVRQAFMAAELPQPPEYCNAVASVLLRPTPDGPHSLLAASDASLFTYPPQTTLVDGVEVPFVESPKDLLMIWLMHKRAEWLPATGVWDGLLKPILAGSAEWLKAINKHFGSAPGPSKVQAGLIGRASPRFQKIVLRLFNLWLHGEIGSNAKIASILHIPKGDAHLGKERPITLAESLIRVFYAIIAARIQVVVEEWRGCYVDKDGVKKRAPDGERATGIFSHLQFAFQAGKSSTTPMTTTKAALQSALHEAAKYLSMTDASKRVKEFLHLLFVDWQKMYDSVGYPGLQIAFRSRGMEPQHVALLMEVHYQATRYSLGPTGDSNLLVMQACLAQGMPDACSSADIFLDPIARILECFSLVMTCGAPIKGSCFADDATPLAKNREDLDEITTGIGQFSRFENVSLEGSKSAYLCIAIDSGEGGVLRYKVFSPLRLTIFDRNTQQIKEVEVLQAATTAEHRHLGVFYTSQGDALPHMDQLGQRLYGRMYKVAHQKFTIAQIRVASNSTIISLPLYGIAISDFGTRVAHQCDVTLRNLLKRAAHECPADSGLYLYIDIKYGGGGVVSIVQEVLAAAAGELDLLLTGEDSESDVVRDMYETALTQADYGTPNSIASGISMCAIYGVMIRYRKYPLVHRTLDALARGPAVWRRPIARPWSARPPTGQHSSELYSDVSPLGKALFTVANRNHGRLDTGGAANPLKERLSKKGVLPPGVTLEQVHSAIATARQEYIVDMALEQFQFGHRLCLRVPPLEWAGDKIGYETDKMATRHDKWPAELQQTECFWASDGSVQTDSDTGLSTYGAGLAAAALPNGMTLHQLDSANRNLALLPAIGPAEQDGSPPTGEMHFDVPAVPIEGCEHMATFPMMIGCSRPSTHTTELVGARGGHSMITLGHPSPGVTDNNTVSGRVDTDCMGRRTRADGRAADKAHLHRLKQLRQAHSNAAPKPSALTPLKTVMLAGPEWRSCPGWLFLSDSQNLSLHEIRSHQVDKRTDVQRIAVAQYSLALHTHQTRARNRQLQKVHQPLTTAYEYWPLPQQIPSLPTGDSDRHARAEWQLWAAGTCGPVGAATWAQKVKSHPSKLFTVASKADGKTIATMMEELVYIVEASAKGVFPSVAADEPLTIPNWVPSLQLPSFTGQQSQAWWQARRATMKASRESYVAYIVLHAQLMNPLKLASNYSVPLAPNTWVESLNDQHADRLASLAAARQLPSNHQLIPVGGKPFIVVINGAAVTGDVRRAVRALGADETLKLASTNGVIDVQGACFRNAQSLDTDTAARVLSGPHCSPTQRRGHNGSGPSFTRWLHHHPSLEEQLSKLTAEPFRCILCKSHEKADQRHLSLCRCDAPSDAAAGGLEDLFDYLGSIEKFFEQYMSMGRFCLADLPRRTDGLMGAYSQFEVISRTGLLGPLAHAVGAAGDRAAGALVGEGQFSAGNVCTMNTETGEDLFYRGALSKDFSKAIFSVWQPTQKELDAPGVKRDDLGRPFWWPKKKQQVERFLVGLVKTVAIANMARWTAMRPRYVDGLAELGITEWRISKTGKLAKKAIVTAPKKKLPFTCRMSDCTRGSSLPSELCNICATLARSSQLSDALNALFNQPSGAAKLAAWRLRPQFMTEQPANLPKMVSMQNQLRNMIPLTRDRRQVPKVLVQVLRTIIQQRHGPYVSASGALPAPPEPTRQATLDFGQPQKTVPCQPPKAKKQAKSTHAGRYQLWVHSVDHVQPLLCVCAHPPIGPRFALTVCPACQGIAQHTHTQQVKTTCSVCNNKSSATILCSFCPNAVCAAPKCRAVALDHRCLLDNKGARSGQQRAVACTQCVRVYSTTADNVRFMENQPEPNFPVNEDGLDLRTVVPNMPILGFDSPDPAPANLPPPVQFLHDRSIVTDSIRKLHDGGRYREAQQGLTCGTHVINNIFERELVTNEFMASEHFRLTGEVVPTSGPFHSRVHEYWFPVQQGVAGSHLFRENEPGNRGFTCFGNPSHLRDHDSTNLFSLTCFHCNSLCCTCQSGVLTPRKHSPYAFIIHEQGDLGQHYRGIRLQSSAPTRVWVNVDSQRHFAQPMDDAALLQELYSLGESDVAGAHPHLVTILREPRPSEAQLNGLAEISALVSRAVKAGAPIGDDGTRLFDGQIILRSCALMSRSSPDSGLTPMDGLTVSADGNDYDDPDDPDDSAVTSALEAFWRRVDAAAVQAEAPPILRGLMHVGPQGHPIPLSTLHWHLDTAVRAPSRIRADDAAWKARRIAAVRQDQRAARAMYKPRVHMLAAQPLPGSLFMEARAQRHPSLPSQFYPRRDDVPAATWKNVHRSCAGFPSAYSLTSTFLTGWRDVKSCCSDTMFPVASQWVRDMMNLHHGTAVESTQAYPAALTAHTPLLLSCLSSIHASNGHAVPHGTYIWVNSGPHLVLVGLSRHMRLTRAVGNNGFATTPALNPIVPLSARRASEAEFPIRWQWWPPGQHDRPDRHVMSASDGAVQVRLDSAGNDTHALGVIGIVDQGHMHNSRGAYKWIERLTLDRISTMTASLDLRPAQRLLLAWSNTDFQLCFNFLVFFDNIDDRMLCAWIPSDEQAAPSAQAEGGIVLTTDGDTPFSLVGVNLGDRQMDASNYMPNEAHNPRLVWLSPFVNAGNLIDTYLVNH